MAKSVLYSFPDAVGKPGIGMTALHQLRGLAGRGVRIRLYCASTRAEVEALERITRTMSIAGRRVPHRLIGLERAYRYHDRRVAGAIKRLGPEAIDLVHCWPWAATETARAAREVGVPVLREVVSSHTAYVYDAVARESALVGMEPPPGHFHTFDPDRLRIEEEEFRLADFLLVPSEFSRQTFVDRGLAPDRLLMHRYGFDPARFSRNGNGSRSEGPFTALFVARCEPLKGLHHALEAWFASGAAEGGRLLICGSFVPGYHEAVKRWLDHPSVELRGFVPNVHELMRESDVLLLPSVVEGSALVSYEAQASGCVLLASDAAGARCVHGEHGLVHPAGDVATLTAQLKRLYLDRAELERLRAGAIGHSHELTWDAAAGELEAAYMAALAS